MLGSIHALDFSQKIRSTLEKLFMFESPKVGRFGFEFRIDSNRIAKLDLAKGIKVELLNGSCYKKNEEARVRKQIKYHINERVDGKNSDWAKA